VTKAHAGLYRQLQELGNQIAEVSEEVKRARLSVEQHEHHLESLDLKVTAIGRWVKAGVSLIVVLLAAVIWLIVRGR
jgi:hypothetical protein